MDNRLKYRMYFFVPYNLSDIQKSIQAGHSALEYAVKYKNEKDFEEFVFWDKTWIILNGGTSNDGHLGDKKGSMQEYYGLLRDKGIHHAVFYEPDINSALTAICFLADERVWDYETYIDFKEYLINNLIEKEYQIINMIRRTDYDTLIKDHADAHYKWIETIGGEKNVFLRELLKGKKLA